MVANGGIIRIITSVRVDEDTLRTLESLADEDASAYLESKTPPLDESAILSQIEQDYLELFKVLLHKGVIELKIAFTGSGSDELIRDFIQRLNAVN